VKRRESPYTDALQREASAWLHEVPAALKVAGGNLSFFSGLAIGLAGNIMISVLFASSSSPSSVGDWVFLAPALTLGVLAWLLLRMTYWLSRLDEDPVRARRAVVNRVALQLSADPISDEELDSMQEEVEEIVRIELSDRYRALRPWAVATAVLTLVLFLPTIAIRTCNSEAAVKTESSAAKASEESRANRKTQPNSPSGGRGATPDPSQPVESQTTTAAQNQKR
jgi:hypothetical protein